MRRISLSNLIRRGFTLIELLVVVAIIGILVAVATANFTTAQKQARDAKRQQDMKDTQTALETYFAETQVYPTESGGDLASAFDSGALPIDPKDDATYFYDWSDTASGSYCICARLETKVGNADGGTVSGCTWNSAGLYYCIQNRQ